MLGPECLTARDGQRVVAMETVGPVLTWHTAHGEEEDTAQRQKEAAQQHSGGVAVQVAFHGSRVAHG